MKRPAKAPRKSAATSPALSVRVDFGAFGAIGPGKIRLLELIARHGSIATAGRAMSMSYRRAWLLAESLNDAFERPLITTQRGGKAGSGAALTPFGAAVIRRYRAIEADAGRAAAKHLAALGRALAEKPPATRRVSPPKRRG
ncbi:MAG: winged helix-turn-helix domain-containing protein [Gemmatimonas sp.]